MRQHFDLSVVLVLPVFIFPRDLRTSALLPSHAFLRDLRVSARFPSPGPFLRDLRVFAGFPSPGLSVWVHLKTGQKVRATSRIPLAFFLRRDVL